MKLLCDYYTPHGNSVVEEPQGKDNTVSEIFEIRPEAMRPGKEGVRKTKAGSVWTIRPEIRNGKTSFGETRTYSRYQERRRKIKSGF